MTILGKTLLIIGATLVGLTLALYATISTFWLERLARMYLGGALLLVGLVFGGLTVLLLNRFVSSRLTHLSASVRRIGTLGDLSARVELNGRDELSQLAHTINHMLAALERARRDQQGAEAELHLQHDFAMQLMNAIPLGVTVTDDEGRFEYVNPAYAHLLGCAPDALIGRTPWDVTHSEDHPVLNTARQQRSQGETTTYETRLVRADGSTVYVLITGTPRWRDGETEGAIVAVTDLTERKRAEEGMRESEARYRQLVETATDIIYRTDAYGRLTYVNPVAVRLSGRTAPDELLGQQYLNWVRPDHRREVARFYLRQYHDQIPTTYLELPIVTREGRELWIGQNVQLLTNSGSAAGFLAVARDITERKRIEAQLREAEAKYRTLVEQIPAIVYIDSLGLDSPLLYIGPRVESLLGYTPAELQTDPELWPRLLHPEDRERALSADEYHLTTGEPLHHEYRLLARDGRLVWVRDEAIIVHDEAGRPLFSQGILLDITDHKRAEAQIRQLNQELEQRVVERTADLESANRAIEEERALLAQRVAERTADLSAANAELARAARLKDEFLASMSHELRTPLNTILGMSEALQEEIYGPLTPKQGDSLRHIEESGRHLLELINDILDLSKIEAGRLDLQIAPTSAETVCQASLRLIKQPAQEKRLQVTYTPDPTVNELQADGRRLKQILVNLLSNAVKFTPKGGHLGLEVKGDSAGQMVRFTVWDSGIGIAQEDQARLFQPFVQLDSRLSRQHSGTGLGLSLVRRMTELHGGSVSLESESGQGSRFTVSFPWHDGMEIDSSESAEEAAPGSIPPGYRVLLIEDSPAAAEQLTRYLSEWGFRSTVHPYGEGAVEKAQETQPQVILLDILLSDLAGWEVLKRLKADPRTRHIPVVVVSVVDEKPVGMALGAAEYLVKPVSREQLKTALSHVLRRTPSTQSLTPAPALSSGRLPLILIADDSEANIRTLSSYLCAHGYRVSVARNGIEAVERALEDRPDAILMDIQMPAMDGLEASHHIRRQAETASIPIIALTALAMAGDRERCLAAGANDYLSKPVSLKALVKAIDAQLKRVPIERVA